MPPLLYYPGLMRTRQYRILAAVSARVCLVTPFILLILVVAALALTGCKTANQLERRTEADSLPAPRSQLTPERRLLFKKHLGNLSEKQRFELFLDQQGVFESQSKLCDRGNFREAQKELESLVTRELDVLPPLNPLVAASRTKLLAVYRALHENEKALATAQEIVEAKSWILGVGSPDTADATATLASLLAEQGKYKQAEEILKKQLEAIKATGNSSTARVLTLYTLGKIAQDQHRTEEARRLFREALSLKKAPESYSSRSLWPLASEIETRLK
jgi:tetratricopeptide (TPR) repeat protein